MHVQWRKRKSAKGKKEPRKKNRGVRGKGKTSTDEHKEETTEKRQIWDLGHGRIRRRNPVAMHVREDICKLGQ